MYDLGGSQLPGQAHDQEMGHLRYSLDGLLHSPATGALHSADEDAAADPLCGNDEDCCPASSSGDGAMTAKNESEPLFVTSGAADDCS